MRSRRLAAIIAVVPLLAVAACGSDDPAPAAGDSGPVSLTVSVLPIAHTAPVQIALSEGIFEKYDLEVEVSQATTGSAVVPSVLNGSVDIAYGNLPSTISARAQGLPIVSIATSDGAALTKESDTNWVMVRADSGIEDAAGLSGKTVAVNALGGLVELITRESVDELGGDPSQLKLTEIPFPEMLGALEAGRVDAVSLTEPFRTIGLQNAANVALFPVGSIGGTRPGQIVDTYFTSEKFLGENGDAVERFRKAIYEAQALAVKDPGVARTAISSYLKIPPPVLEVMNLPQWVEEPISEDDFDYISGLMTKYDVLEDDKAPAYEDVVRE